VYTYIFICVVHLYVCNLIDTHQQQLREGVEGLECRVIYVYICVCVYVCVYICVCVYMCGT